MRAALPLRPGRETNFGINTRDSGNRQSNARFRQRCGPAAFQPVPHKPEPPQASPRAARPAGTGGGEDGEDAPGGHSESPEGPGSGNGLRRSGTSLRQARCLDPSPDQGAQRCVHRNPGGFAPGRRGFRRKGHGLAGQRPACLSGPAKQNASRTAGTPSSTYRGVSS